MMLWTAMLLGLAGSLHCLGMCGPLILALPALHAGRAQTPPSAASVWGARLVYHTGRIATYGALGILFGLIGQTAAWAGWQRWISIAAGILILAGLAGSRFYRLSLPVARLIGFLRPRLGALFRSSSLGAVFLAGALNGLLPCGLVYVAGAGSMTVGGLWPGVLFMLAFGLGTLPMMLGVGWVGMRWQNRLRLRWHRWVPASVVLVAGLLILRGLGLGIPYLSPGPLEQANACAACAQHADFASHQEPSHEHP